MNLIWLNCIVPPAMKITGTAPSTRETYHIKQKEIHVTPAIYSRECLLVRLISFLKMAQEIRASRNHIHANNGQGRSYNCTPSYSVVLAPSKIPSN